MLEGGPLRTPLNGKALDITEFIDELLLITREALLAVDDTLITGKYIEEPGNKSEPRKDNELAILKRLNEDELFNDIHMGVLSKKEVIGTLINEEPLEKIKPLIEGSELITSAKLLMEANDDIVEKDKLNKPLELNEDDNGGNRDVGKLMNRELKPVNTKLELETAEINPDKKLGILRAIK